MIQVSLILRHAIGIPVSNTCEHYCGNGYTKSYFHISLCLKLRINSIWALSQVVYANRTHYRDGNNSREHHKDTQVYYCLANSWYQLRSKEYKSDRSYYHSSKCDPYNRNCPGDVSIGCGYVRLIVEVPQFHRRGRSIGRTYYQDYEYYDEDEHKNESAHLLRSKQDSMGNTTQKHFSTATQSTLDMKKYSGQWYVVFNTTQDNSCGMVVAYYLAVDSVLNMTTYCYSNKELKYHTQSTGVAPNKYEPSKLVVRTSGSYGTTKHWVYYTDYVTYAIVGSGEPNSKDTGSDFMILSRERTLSKSVRAEVESKISSYGLADNIDFH